MPTFEERLRNEYKIELLEIIGEGAQAKCWKARHQDVGLCAVKIYHRHVNSDVEAKNVIGRELEAAQLFQQPSLILPLQNSYRIESTLVTRWMLGTESLQDVADRSPQGIDKATCDAWFSNIAAALDLVHSAEGDWVHADVKPSNMIMLGKLPCLCDFGVAYRSSSLTSTMASKGRLGTRAFMPISECEGRPTRFSDVYAFLLSYIYLRQGRHPLGDNESEVIVNQDRNNYDLSGLAAPEQKEILKAIAGGINEKLLDWFTRSICQPHELDPKQRHHILRSEILTASARLETELANQFKANEQQSRPTLGWMAANSSQFYGKFRKDLLAAIRLRNEMAHNETNLSIHEMEQCLQCLCEAYELLLPRTTPSARSSSKQETPSLDDLPSEQTVSQPTTRDDETTVQLEKSETTDQTRWEFPKTFSLDKIEFFERLADAKSNSERVELFSASSTTLKELIEDWYLLFDSKNCGGFTDDLLGAQSARSAIEEVLQHQSFNSLRKELDPFLLKKSDEMENKIDGDDDAVLNINAVEFVSLTTALEHGAKIKAAARQNAPFFQKHIEDLIPWWIGTPLHFVFAVAFFGPLSGLFCCMLMYSVFSLKAFSISGLIGTAIVGFLLAGVVNMMWDVSNDIRRSEKLSVYIIMTICAFAGGAGGIWELNNEEEVTSEASQLGAVSTQVVTPTFRGETVSEIEFLFSNDFWHDQRNFSLLKQSNAEWLLERPTDPHGSNGTEFTSESIESSKLQQLFKSLYSIESALSKADSAVSLTENGAMVFRGVELGTQAKIKEGTEIRIRFAADVSLLLSFSEEIDLHGSNLETQLSGNVRICTISPLLPELIEIPFDAKELGKSSYQDRLRKSKIQGETFDEVVKAVTSHNQELIDKFREFREQHPEEYRVISSSLFREAISCSKQIHP